MFEPELFPWYSLDHLPAGTVHGIEWRWPGYEVVGATVTDKKGRRHFYEVRDKALAPLPCHPEAWRPNPKSGKAWSWPNGVEPAPLKRTLLPSISTIGGIAFDSVSSAELAEEMDANREAMRTTNRASNRDDWREKDATQWWRDPTRILYQPMGSVTREHAEARIMRCLILDRSIGMDFKATRTNAAALADLKRTLADVLAEDREVDWVPPIHMIGSDHADYDTVMGWLLEVMLSRRELKALVLRTRVPALSWDEIGGSIRRSREAARTIYLTTIDVLTAVANRPARLAATRLAALQERNRAHRRRA